MLQLENAALAKSRKHTQIALLLWPLLRMYLNVVPLQSELEGAVLLASVTHCPNVAPLREPHQSELEGAALLASVTHLPNVVPLQCITFSLYMHARSMENL